MKKNCFFTLLLFIIFPISNLTAQSSTQKNLLRSFFNRSDVQNIIQKVGHPTPTPKGVTITSISDNTVTFRADYSSSWVGDYSCTYKLVLNDSGNFIRSYSAQCGCPGFSSCFEATEFSRIINYINEDGEALTSSNRAVKMQEEMKGKPLDRFTAQELLCCSLFLIWYNEGFYYAY